MVHELKKSIEVGNVVFGVKETLKNSRELEKIIVSSDCREDIIERLKNSKVNIELMEFSKKELASKLELDFECEVFGVRR